MTTRKQRWSDSDNAILHPLFILLIIYPGMQPARFSLFCVKNTYNQKMVLSPAWQKWANEAKSYWERMGAESNAARLFALLWGIASVNGYQPRITSVFRDPKRQQELLDQWNAGQRAGFIGKPADPSKSKHTQTSFWGRPAALAMDMPSNNIPAVDRIATDLGLGVGSSFRSPDPGHYYVR